MLCGCLFIKTELTYEGLTVDSPVDRGYKEPWLALTLLGFLGAGHPPSSCVILICKFILCTRSDTSHTSIKSYSSTLGLFSQPPQVGVCFPLSPVPGSSCHPLFLTLASR
jgi:hypothetical protein